MVWTHNWILSIYLITANLNKTQFCTLRCPTYKGNSFHLLFVEEPNTDLLIRVVRNPYSWWNTFLWRINYNTAVSAISDLNTIFPAEGILLTTLTKIFTVELYLKIQPSLWKATYPLRYFNTDRDLNLTFKIQEKEALLHLLHFYVIPESIYWELSSFSVHACFQPIPPMLFGES